MEPGADELGHLQVHQLLGEKLESVTQELRVSALLCLAEQVE